MVPEADVVHGGLILADGIRRQVLDCRKAALLEAVQRVSLPREFNAPANVALFLGEFVGRYDVLLDYRGENGSSNNGDGNENADGPERGSQPSHLGSGEEA